MPTGGVETTEDNLTSWLKAVQVRCLGSKLITKNFLEAKDYAGIRIFNKTNPAIVKEIKSR